MLTILFAAAAVVHVVLLASTFKLQSGAIEWLVRLLFLGLIADNSILALSQYFFEASWYYPISLLRYLAHVLLLPPLAFAALLLAARARVPWAAGNTARWLCLLFVVAAIGFGLATEIAGLDLVKETLLGHARYVSIERSLPLATIATIVVVLGLSAAIWTTARWPWLFVAALTIFVVNAASASTEWGIITGNLAEVVFLSGWVASLFRFRLDPG